MLPGSPVVGAFHHVSAVLLLDPEVTSVDRTYWCLATTGPPPIWSRRSPRFPGVRGVYAGRLRNCGQVEALTANLVFDQPAYKAHAGLRVTDI